MRLTHFALVGILLVPATGFAQARHRERPEHAPPRWELPARTPAWWELPRNVAAPRYELPQFTVDPRTGFPMAVSPRRHRGLPLAPIGLQPSFGSHPAAGQKWHGRHSRGRSLASQSTVILMVPSLPFAPEAAPVAHAAPTPPPYAEPQSRKGSLFLDVQPGTAQIFVDRFYAGTPDDLSAAGRGLLLDAGPHTIDLMAPGYEPLTFDVRVAPDEPPLLFRQRLKATAPPPVPAPAAVIQPSTFYLIPGCYMGNIPPKDARLPSTCDVSRAVTINP